MLGPALHVGSKLIAFVTLMVQVSPPGLFHAADSYVLLKIQTRDSQLLKAERREKAAWPLWLSGVGPGHQHQLRA